MGPPARSMFKWVRAKNTGHSLLTQSVPWSWSWTSSFLDVSVHSYQDHLVKSEAGVFWDFFLQNPSFTWTINQQPMRYSTHLWGHCTLTKPQAPEFSVTNTELWKCRGQNTHATALPSFSWSPLLQDTLTQLRCSNSFRRNMDHWEGSFFELLLSQGLGRSNFWDFTDTRLNTSFVLGGSWDIGTIFIFLVF